MGFQQSQFHVGGWGFFCGDLCPGFCLRLGKGNPAAFSRDCDFGQEVFVAVFMEGGLADLCRLSVVLYMRSS